MRAKFDYFRSKRHLRNVAALPCQICGREGHSQAAHGNESAFGKGKGIKSSDEFTAALCCDCHADIDSGRGMSREQRRLSWYLAHLQTRAKLEEAGLWPAELQRKETA